MSASSSEFRAWNAASSDSPTPYGGTDWNWNVNDEATLVWRRKQVRQQEET